MSQRGKSNKAMAFPNDYIALGAKTGAGTAVKRGPDVSSGPSSSGIPTGPLIKKVKPVSSASMPVVASSSLLDKGIRWESIALDVDVTDLTKAILAAEESNSMERVEGLLCGAVKVLRNQRAKPDQLLYLSLMFLAKSNSYLFSASEYVLEAFCSLLKRDVKESYKSKGNALVSVLSANVLMAAFQKERNWPELFVRVFIDDAMGERVWVDHPDCKGFVDNIVTAFNTKIPNQTQSFFLKPESSGREQCASPPIGGGGSGSGSGSATPTRVGDDDSMQGIESNVPLNLEGRDFLDVSVSPRYVGLQNSIETIVMDIVREHLNRRQGTENITKNILKFLTSACGLVEVRLMVVSKIEMWLMNPKLSRTAHDLLLALAVNCNTHTPMDVEVIANFSKLRFKNKPNINMYLQCVREICNSHSENLPTLVKQTIFNELSNARNTNNMNVLNIIFSTDGERAPASLAAVFLDLLMQKDCYLRALRALLREIVRVLKHDMNLAVFCQHLMQDKSKDQVFKDFDQKDRMLSSITDLISLSMFLGISPQVREVYGAYQRGEDKDLSSFRSFLKQLALIQRDAMWWMHEVVLKMYKPLVPGTAQAPGTFLKCLHKLLLMVSIEEQSMTDGWPAESDRHFYFKATSEIPLYQETLLRIFFIGLSSSHPLIARDAVDIAEFITKRAAGLHALENEDFRVLYCDVPKDVFDCLINLTTYSYPDTIALPADYNPPTLAIAQVYWKIFIILVMYCAHNPTIFGSMGWEEYPTLKAFMEMCITNQFVFPPQTLTNGEQADILKAKELQTTAIEKQSILTLERHLASNDNINEGNSLLLPQLITLNPRGPLRRPPPAVLEQLQQINKHHKIGHLLCRSRNPDFLLDILSRQGTNQSLPWLSDLVESNEGSFNLLPVQCLCEFLLTNSIDSVPEDETNASAEASENNRKKKQEQLLKHLQSLLQDPESDKQICFETLDYFLRRLSSQHTQQRLQALKGLRLVLTPLISPEDQDVIVEYSNVNTNNKWLLQHLPSLPFFSDCYPHISSALRGACQVENDQNTVGLYIQFLASYSPSSLPDLADLCLDMASIIVERSTILPAILPGPQCKADNAEDTFLALLRLFNNFMRRIKSPNPEENKGSWNPENASGIITVVFHDSLTASMHFFVVHAQIILLTFFPPNSQSLQVIHNEMLMMWFSSQRTTPRSYLQVTREEAVLIPDWLKLKMIRSDSPVLVDAALKDLEPHQLVLFIQSFGIPVMSMTKLLQALDIAVQSDVQIVNDAVMDKNYMGQLVAVQHRRGARNGTIFADALQLNLNSHLQIKRGPGMMNDEEKKIIALGQLSEPVIPPRSTAMIPPNQIKGTLLHLFDVGSPSRMTMREKQDAYRTLQKFISSEMRGNGPGKPMLDAVVKAFDQILKSDLKSNFVNALLQRTSFSCGLIRLVTTSLKRTPNYDSSSCKLFVKASEVILGSSKESSNLHVLLKDFLKTCSKKVTKFSNGDELMNDNFEKDFQKQVEEALNKKTTHDLVNSMANMLLYQSDGLVKNARNVRSGLIIDWLEMVDPEMIQLEPRLQQQLLFAKCSPKVKRENDNSPKRCVVPSRPYLLSMLTHETSWSSLNQTIEFLLEKFNPDLDASAVLDFLTACIFIPKLWLGKDKHVPKHAVNQDLLALNRQQLICLVDYALLEASDSPGNPAGIFRERSKLVFCCLPDRSKSVWVTDYLIEKLKAGSDDFCKKDDAAARGVPTIGKELIQELLLQLYMKIPNCLASEFDSFKTVLPDRLDSSENVSSFDCVSHTLLSALAGTQHGRQWASQMLEYEASARKLAATHPLLMLRNLPLIAASLKGRTEFEFSFFRSRNHLTLYSMSLGLLEILKPFVFRVEYQHSLEEALQCYFEMLDAYFHRRDSFIGVIDKFMAFLHEYVDVEPRRALKFIQTYGTMLPAMQKSMQGLSSLQSLVTRVSFNNLPCTSGGHSDLARREVAKDVEQFSTVLRNLEEAKEDEVMQTLSDLSNAAMAKPYILESFAEELSGLMSCEQQSIRHQSYALIMRLWRYSPNIGDCIADNYIKCLESKENAIALTALEKLPDIILLAQDKMAEILQTVFCLGLHSNINVTSYLADTISVLNTQAGL